MSCWANRKLNELKNYAIKMAKSHDIENKENIPDVRKSDSDKSKATIKYLYVDSSFMEKNFANDDHSRRIEGGQYQEEMYYDCQPITSVDDAEEKRPSESVLNQQQNFSVNDVFNTIENPQEFKMALKQLVFNSNALYRTFRQAYCKTKKSRKTLTRNSGRKCKCCLKCGGEIVCQQKDRGDMNIESPAFRMASKTQERIRSFGVPQEDHCTNCCNHYATCCSSLVNPRRQLAAESQTEPYSLTECSPCFVDTGISLEPEDEMHSHNVCEKCLMPKEEFQLFKNRQMEECSNICQLCDQPNTVNCVIKPNNQLPPISLTIPLKLQINSQGGKLRFMDTESTIQVKQNTFQQSSMPETSSLQEQQENQDFGLCTSTPASIETLQAAPGRRISKESFDQLQIEEIKQVSEGVQCSSIASIAMPAEIQDDYANTDMITNVKSVQTLDLKTKKSDHINTDILSTTAQKPLVTDPTPNTELDQLRMKAERLRAELVHELSLALEQSLPAEAFKVLQKERRFSENDSRRPRYNADITTARRSLPVNYQALHLKPQELKPLASGLIIGNEQFQTAGKPPYASESSIADTGRISRNKRRTFIQQKLYDLLHPDTAQLEPKYSIEQRNEILNDFYKLLHPKEYHYLSKEVIRLNALSDISLMLESEPTENRPILTRSQENFLEDLRHILNPKVMRKEGSIGKKYRKEIKDKILEDLQIILTKDSTAADEENREQVLHDIRNLLDTGIEKRQSLPITQIRPSTSKANKSSHQLAPRPQSSITGSLLHDLISKLDENLNEEEQKRRFREESSAKKRPPTRPENPRSSSSLSS